MSEKLLNVVKELFVENEIDCEVETSEEVETISFLYFECAFEEIEYDAEVCLVIDEEEKTVATVMNIVDLETEEEVNKALKLCNAFNQMELLYKAYIDKDNTVVLEYVAHHNAETLKEHLFDDLDVLFDYEDFYKDLLK